MLLVDIWVQFMFNQFYNINTHKSFVEHFPTRIHHYEGYRKKNPVFLLMLSAKPCWYYLLHPWYVKASTTFQKN